MKKVYVHPSISNSNLNKPAFPAVVAAALKVGALLGGYAAGRAVTNAMKIYPIEKKLVAANVSI